METKVDQIGIEKLGNSDNAHKLSRHAQERAVWVLGDPLVLKQAGAAAPLLAVVNEKCGERESCRLKYSSVAADLAVSTTTLKSWAALLEQLGFFKRQPCGPAGVDIMLNPARWPSGGTGTALDASVLKLVAVLEAARLTVDGALRSAVTDVQDVRAAA